MEPNCYHSKWLKLRAETCESHILNQHIKYMPHSKLRLNATYTISLLNRSVAQPSICCISLLLNNMKEGPKSDSLSLTWNLKYRLHTQQHEGISHAGQPWYNIRQPWLNMKSGIKWLGLLVFKFIENNIFYSFTGRNFKSRYYIYVFSLINLKKRPVSSEEIKYEL